MVDQKQEILISQPVYNVYLHYSIGYISCIQGLSIQSGFFSILSNASRDQKFKMAAQKQQIVTEWASILNFLFQITSHNVANSFIELLDLAKIDRRAGIVQLRCIKAEI